MSKGSGGGGAGSSGGSSSNGGSSKATANSVVDSATSNFSSGMTNMLTKDGSIDKLKNVSANAYSQARDALVSRGISDASSGRDAIRSQIYNKIKTDMGGTGSFGNTDTYKNVARGLTDRLIIDLIKNK